MAFDSLRMRIFNGLCLDDKDEENDKAQILLQIPI